MNISHLKICLVFASLLIMASIPLTVTAQAENSAFIKSNEHGGIQLTVTGASHFAGLALHCVHQEFPNKPGHVMMDAASVLPPQQLHPAFYGCFDWHSSVHGHWMLVRLLKSFPDMPEAQAIRQALNANLTAEKLRMEADYFQQEGAKSFERTYGWAWLLKLVEELDTWDDPDGLRWRANLEPLENIIVARYLDFLPRQTYAIRTGEHPNTAFGLAFALDYARTVGNTDLQSMIESRSMDYFFEDKNCPASWEPGGADFLSPCLEEADLMRRILPEQAFRDWLRQFLPGIEEAKPINLYKPAEVSDRSDPKIVHLDGLNLSRAWCLYGIKQTLYGAGTDNTTIVAQAADAHIKATLPHIASGDYAGEHWLASFAVYALSEAEKAYE